MHCPSFTAIVLLQLSLLSVLQGAKWAHNGPDGEHHWPKKFPFCGGAFQSPIDIRADLVRFDPTLPPIVVQNYNLTSSEQLTLENTGETVELSLPPRLQIAGLPSRYTAAQLHFHWGSSSRPTGSEHTVNGLQFAAEMHVVHYNSDKYPNISAAIDKSDGLAVLGVLIEIGEFNPAYENILRFINRVSFRDQEVHIPGFDIATLLPSRLDEYYRYDGSLTTPPCFPSVLWTVFRNHVTISSEQFLSLATTVFATQIQDSAPMLLNDNFRESQLIDSRIVLVSFKGGRGLHGSPLVTSPFTRKHIVQQLLVGDLADLADEGLFELLPETLHTGKNKNLKNQQSGTHAKSHQQILYPSLSKKAQANRSVGKLRLAKDALCFTTLKCRVLKQLRQSRTENQLVRSLRDTAFPLLNLKSFLNCKSDLALPTIRNILQERATDEAVELSHSLTKTLTKPRKHNTHNSATTPMNQNVAKANLGVLTPAPASRKPHGNSYPFPWLLQIEWED